jgi:hypothetical protein
VKASKSSTVAVIFASAILASAQPVISKVVPLPSPGYTSAATITFSMGGVTASQMIACMAASHGTNQTGVPNFVSDSLNSTWLQGPTTNELGPGQSFIGGMASYYTTLNRSGNELITLSTITTKGNPAPVTTGFCAVLSDVSGFDSGSIQNSSSSSTISSGIFATTSTDDLVVCAFADPLTSGPFTVGNGYTQLGSQNVFAFGAESQVVGAAGTYAGTMTDINSGKPYAGSSSQGACMAFLAIPGTSVAQAETLQATYLATTPNQVTASCPSSSCNTTQFTNTAFATTPLFQQQITCPGTSTCTFHVHVNAQLTLLPDQEAICPGPCGTSYDVATMQYVGDGKTTSNSVISWQPNPSNTSSSLNQPDVPFSQDFIVNITNSSENQKHPVEIDVGCAIYNIGPQLGGNTCSISNQGGGDTLRVDVFTP